MCLGAEPASDGRDVFFVAADCHPQTIAVVDDPRRGARHRGRGRRPRRRVDFGDEVVRRPAAVPRPPTAGCATTRRSSSAPTPPAPWWWWPPTCSP